MTAYFTELLHSALWALAAALSAYVLGAMYGGILIFLTWLALLVNVNSEFAFWTGAITFGALTGTIGAAFYLNSRRRFLGMICFVSITSFLICGFFTLAVWCLGYEVAAEYAMVTAGTLFVVLCAHMLQQAFSGFKDSKRA